MTDRYVMRLAAALATACIGGCGIQPAASSESAESKEEAMMTIGRSDPTGGPRIPSCPIYALCSPDLEAAGIAWIAFDGTSSASARVSSVTYPLDLTILDPRFHVYVLGTSGEPDPAGIIRYKIVGCAQEDRKGTGLCSGPAAAGATCAVTFDVALRDGVGRCDPVRGAELIKPSMPPQFDLQ